MESIKILVVDFNLFFFFKAFFFTLEELTVNLSGLCGLTVKEFMSSLFSGFNYFEQCLLVAGAFKTGYNLILRLIKV